MSYSTYGVSFDGKTVVFSSPSTNLVTNEINEYSDIFLYDGNYATLSRISVKSFCIEANQSSDVAAVSSNGKYVTFWSMAGNLISNDPMNMPVAGDLLLYNRATGKITRVSVPYNGSGNLATNGQSYHSAISNDGRYVAFDSSASNLVADDTNDAWDIFVYDTLRKTTKRVSVATGSIQAVGGDLPMAPSISGDGRYIVLYS